MNATDDFRSVTVDLRLHTTSLEVCSDDKSLPFEGGYRGSHGNNRETDKEMTYILPENSRVNPLDMLEETLELQHMQTNENGANCANCAGAHFVDGIQDTESVSNSMVVAETEQSSIAAGNTCFEPMTKSQAMKSWLDMTLDSSEAGRETHEDVSKLNHSLLRTGSADNHHENNNHMKTDTINEADMSGASSIGDINNCDMNGAVKSQTCDLNVGIQQTDTVNIEDDTENVIKTFTNDQDSVENNITDNQEAVPERFDQFTSSIISMKNNSENDSAEMEDESEMENLSKDSKCPSNLELDKFPEATECLSKISKTSVSNVHSETIDKVSGNEANGMTGLNKARCNDPSIAHPNDSDNSDTDHSAKSSVVKSENCILSHNPVLEKAFLQSKDYLLSFAEMLYKCTLCTKIPSIFTSKQSFINHVSHNHLTKQMNFVDCTKCSLKFRTVDDINEHDTLAHCSGSDVSKFQSHDGKESETAKSHVVSHDCSVASHDLAEDSDSASSGHGSVGCHKTKLTELEKDFMQPHTNCNHAGIEMKNGSLDLSLKDLMTSQQDATGKSFKPKTVQFSPRSNERHSPHVDMTRLHKITDQIVKSNAPNKTPPNSMNIGFTPSYTHEFGKFTKLVREGGNIVYFCQVCNWKSPVKSTFQIHCGLNGHKVKVLSVEEQGNGCINNNDSSQSQRSIEIDKSQMSNGFKLDQSQTSPYNINSSPNVCINKQSNCQPFKHVEASSWMSYPGSYADSGKVINMKGLPFRLPAFGENDRLGAREMSGFETINSVHRNGSAKKDNYESSTYKNGMLKNNKLLKHGELTTGTSSSRHKRRSPTSRHEREWSESDSDSENETKKKRIYLGPRKHKTRILSTLLKPNVSENCMDISNFSYSVRTEKSVLDNETHDNRLSNHAACLSSYAASRESRIKNEKQDIYSGHDMNTSSMRSTSANPGSIDLSIVKTEATDLTTDRKAFSESVNSKEYAHSRYESVAHGNNGRKLDNQKHEKSDSLDNVRMSPSSETQSLFKLYRCHACLYEYSDIGEYEHHFETVHKSAQIAFTSGNGPKMSSKTSDTDLGNVEMNENWRVNKLKEMLPDFLTVDDKGNVSRDFLLQRVSIVAGLPDMVGWSSACNRAVREVFPSSLAQRKGKYKKTYFFGVSIVETPAPREDLSLQDSDLLSQQQPLRDMSIDMEKILAHMPAVVYWTGDMERGVYRDQMLVILADILDDPDVKGWGAQCNRAIRMMYPHVEMKRKGKFKTTVYFGVDFMNTEYQAFVDSPKISAPGVVKNPFNNQESGERRHLLDLIHSKIMEAHKDTATLDVSQKNASPFEIAEDSAREVSPADTREGTPVDLKQEPDADSDKLGGLVGYSPVYPSWFREEARSEMRDYLARFGGVTMFDTGDVDDNDGDDERDPECDAIDNDNADSRSDSKTILNVPVIEKDAE